jgi:phage virion morphogenesis protein
MRFRTEMGPDGQKWKPSLRARITGGRTLTKDGHLSGSISARHGRDYAEWGVNRIYAAIHQFGGEIHAKGGSLRFRLANGGFATVQKVTMPARPFLGISDDDRDDILDAIQVRIQASIPGGAHAG